MGNFGPDPNFHKSEMCKSEIFAQFKKIFNDIDETQIHNYYFCTERHCNEICSDDLKTAKKITSSNTNGCLTPTLQSVTKPISSAWFT